MLNHWLRNSSTSLGFISVLMCSAFLGTTQAQSSKIFESEEVIEITLSTDMKSLMKDRGDDPQYHKANLKYPEGASVTSIPLKIKTRGHFRKMSSNCKYPPLLLNFKKSVTPESSLFAGLDKVKLVTPCRGDALVVNEYLVYKLYNLFTPKSFNVRLLKVIFHDSVSQEKSDAYYGMLIEEEKQMAERNASKPFEKIGLNHQAVNDEEFLQMAVFQFMIGNTDWSIQYLQNIKLIVSKDNRQLSCIPYDFDHAGIVRAPYAKPAPELELPSTSDRRYRGYCAQEMGAFDEVFETFRSLKTNIYSLYEENPLIKESYQKQTLKFLTKFFETINDPKKAENAFLYPCDPNGTGRVVIKGLRETKD